MRATALVPIASMLSQPFIRHAFVAGTAVAVPAGLVGYFLVLRGQVFTGDALSHVAFTGALAALAAGLDLRLGLFGATVLVAIGIGILGRAGRADDVVIGSVFVWVLGLGVLFLSLYTSARGGANGTAGVAVLFGSIFGLSSSEAWIAVAIGVVCAGALVLMARPLVFATLDPAIAAARRVPVRALGIVFLGVVGLTAAETTQAVGALLLLGLLAAPGAAAQRLTGRPFGALALSSLLAVLAVWSGLVISYVAPTLPPSFCIVCVAAAIYGVAALTTWIRAAAGRRAGLTGYSR